MIEQRVEGGPDCSASVKHIIHQNDVFPDNRKVDLSCMHDGSF